MSRAKQARCRWAVRRLPGARPTVLPLGVGLVARVIEVGGIPMPTHSLDPGADANSGSAPPRGHRLPPGGCLGRPHDAKGQRTVPCAILAPLDSAAGPTPASICP